MEFTTKELEGKRKRQKTIEARRDLIMTNAAINLVYDNNLACVVTINGISIGLCQNLEVLPALKYHKAEIEKFLNGDPNEWE